jgi:redox-sensitive bicupin YhaK (pirin superfamily)
VLISLHVEVRQSKGIDCVPQILAWRDGRYRHQSTDKRLGVGEHPHRGFETVTIVYSGEVEYRDSSGGGGSIGSGDVQWMTAGSGIVHEEFHGGEFTRQGSLFEMIQLWVNLPAKDKMTPSCYQGILSSQSPAVSLPDDRGSVRVIAGEFAGAKGPANTYTPIHVWDLRLASDQPFDLAVPDGYTTALVVLKGAARINGAEAIEAAEVGLFDRAGEALRIESANNATALLLSGEPIDEPIVGSGPFVMNTSDEIRQAIADYQSGKMGTLS